MDGWLKDLFFTLWFFLPAGLANAAPIFVAKMPIIKAWDAPIDGHKTYRGRRILGDHKTWRGLVVGILMSTFVLWLQQIASAHIGWVHDWTSQVDYAALTVLIVGPLFGLGALGGDAIESFFKRQRDVAPGHGWFPFDQTDYVIGTAIVTAPFVQLQFIQYVQLLFIWLLIHVVASYVGYLLHLKERPI